MTFNAMKLKVIFLPFFPLCTIQQHRVWCGGALGALVSSFFFMRVKNAGRIRIGARRIKMLLAAQRFFVFDATKMAFLDHLIFQKTSLAHSFPEKRGNKSILPIAVFE